MFKLYEHDFCSIVTRVFRKVRSVSDTAEFAEKYVGTNKRMSYDPFSPALYFERNRRSRKYELSDCCSYTYSRGKWYAERVTHSAENSAALGALLKNTDFLMRKYLKVKSAMKSAGLSNDEEKLICGEIEAYLREKREAERPEVKLDLSKLSGIRAAALETQNLLLGPQQNEDENSDSAFDNDVAAQNETRPKDMNEEKPPAGDVETAHIENADKHISEQNETGDAVGLTDAEKLLLALLIDGRPYQTEMLSASVLPSVAADSINEKLMDVLNDTAIIDNGVQLEIIEDYIDELKGILGKA